MIIFDQDWNPQMDKQAVARAHRVGQKHEVLVLRFITTSAVEENMEMRCKEKLEMERKIIGAGGFAGGAKDAKKAGKGGKAEEKGGSHMTSQADFLRKLIEDARAAEAAEAERRQRLGLDKKDGDDDMDGGKKKVAAADYAASAGSRYTATGFAELDDMLERHTSERAGFAGVDKKLGLEKVVAEDKSKNVKSGKDVEGDTEGVTRALVASNRLMRVDEVPEGFIIQEDSEEDDD